MSSILLVDDNAWVRETLAELLEALGHAVRAAGDAEEALRAHAAAATAGAPVELAVLDVHMPAVSGPALLQRLRARDPGLPALFITGYMADALPPGLLPSPGVAVLSKPFVLAELQAAIEDVMGSAGSPRGPS